MLKKILLPVLAVLLIAAAAAVYLFSVNSAHFTQEETTVDVTETEPAYVIRFTDADGNPVPGVMANVCDETACTMLTADDEGVARFSGEEKEWGVQILKVPEGFTFDSGEKTPLNAEGETVIVLNKE
jgi:hypothetical protein